MDDTMVQSYRTYVHRIRKFLFLGGVLPSATIRPILSYCSAILTASVCFSMSCVIFNFCLVNVKNLNVVTKSMSLMCSLIATSLKATCFIMRREDLIELHETLDKLFNEELTNNRKTRSTLLSLLHTFDRPAYIFSFLIGATLSVYFLPPVVLITRQLIRHAEPRQYLLPFPATFPWTIEGGGLFYQMHFLYETLVSWFLLFTNSGVDALFGFYIFQMASLLRAMAYRLKHPEPDENRAELLRACVKKHRQLLRCRDILQGVYGPIILWLVLTNGIVMCALIFQAFQTKEMTLGKAALFAFYMFLKIVQTFTYAWYGGIVTTESETFRQGLYFSDWLGERSKHLKTELLITMIQKPMTVTASRFFNVSVDMFTKILNTTMSYFFLLQTLDESG